MKIKNIAAVVLGLLLGVIVAIPVFWKGIQRGLNTMYSQAEMDFVTVEQRLQTMSDHALNLRKVLYRVGWHGSEDPFLRVEESRSWLNGKFPLAAKMGLAEDLERALLETESVWAKAARNRQHIRKNIYYRQWGMEWEKLKRYLVKEEKIFNRSSAEYSAGLNHWVFELFVTGKRVDFSSYFDEYYIEVGRKKDRDKAFRVETGSPSFHIQDDLAGVRQGMRDKNGDLIFLELPKPYWLAEAPLPEHDYKEIQYDRSATMMAVTEIQNQNNLVVDEAPVYENRNAPESFKAARVQKQTRVIY